jgi:UDP-N-acetylglucosamine 2-epimerase
MATHNNRHNYSDTAIKHFEAALRVATEEKFPEIRQMVQVNLASAQYEASLQSYTETSHPEKWMVMQNSLGVAYLALAAQNDRENYADIAIEHFEAALRVATVDSFPEVRQIIQANLARVQRL